MSLFNCCGPRLTWALIFRLDLLSLSLSFVRLGADGVHGVDGYVEQPTVAGSTHAEADFWRMRTGAAILEDFGRNGRMDTKA